MIARVFSGPITGRVTAPPSKSMAHRAILAAALAEGESRVLNLSFGRDVRATVKAVAQMGAEVMIQENWVDIIGSGDISAPSRPVSCGESGSTLRFLLPVLSLTGEQVEFTGKGRLFQRPESVYQKIFEAQGSRFEQNEQGIILQGKLKPGKYQLPGNVSSQFVTGLLFALPLLERPSTLNILPPFESRPYVEMTLSVLKEFGIEAEWQDEEHTQLYIPAPQTYRSRDYTVEGDYSQAAFFAVLGALCGGVKVRGLNPETLQGDAAILDILHRCGAKFTRHEDELVFEKSELTATEIDLAPCPDLGPVLMVLAMFCRGTTVIRNAGRLRLKESDRIASMQQELLKFGAEVMVEGDTLKIAGVQTIQPGLLFGHNDHRVVMSLAIAGLAGGWDVSIHGADAVQKSWPDFFGVLESLGIGVKWMDE